MTWKELRNSVYKIDGSWRDIYVLNTSKEDWLKWINYVNANFPVIWNDTESKESQDFDKIDLETVVRHFNGGEFNSLANVFMDGIRVNAHFFTENELENDINPSSIKSIHDHNRLMEYMKSVSKLLNKEVILTCENCKECVLIKIYGEQIGFVA